jgi:tRNA A37 N6-isopentenylltransferase MiaA
MFESGVQDEVRRALAGPISITARKTMGIDEIATLPPGEALDALVARTRRYAGYQRKWMRRVPAIVMVDAHRPVGEIADDIVALACTRERLPRL